MPAYARKPAPEQARGARGRAGRRRSLPPGRLCRPHGHSRTAARAPAAADGHAGPALAGDAGLVEALRAELMVRFTIDARPIRAEGATEACRWDLVELAVTDDRVIQDLGPAGAPALPDVPGRLDSTQIAYSRAPSPVLARLGVMSW